MQRALHTIIAGLIQRTWLVVLATALACSAFAAHAVAALAEAKYLAPSARGVSLPSPAPARAPAPAPPRSRDGSALVARNMFCSECTPPVQPAGPLDSFTPNAQLIATSIGTDSRATLRVLDTEAQGSWGVGEVVPGVGTITRIGWVSVDLVDASGRVGKLTLLDSPTLAAVSRGGAGAATPATAATAEPWEGRIKKLDDHTFEVERALVRELVSAPTKGAAIRVSPISKGGKLEGLRLFGVRPGTLAASLGLHNGDTLSEINGTHIDSLNTLLDLYSKLDTLSVVQFEGTRAGKPLGIEMRLK